MEVDMDRSAQLWGCVTVLWPLGASILWGGGGGWRLSCRLGVFIKIGRWGLNSYQHPLKGAQLQPT